MISNEDAEIAKAIEQSLQENKSTSNNLYEPLNPEQRKREEGMPCGLQNIGNSKSKRIPFPENQYFMYSVFNHDFFSLLF
jgi:hypothetical protein